MTRGNGTTTSYSYDSQSALHTLNHDLAGTADDIQFAYSRNQVGEIIANDIGNPAYVWQAPGSRADHYDANGLNQYTGVNSQPIGYDGNGNLTSDGSKAFAYDTENRLIGATGDNLTAALAYDPVGRLRRTTIDGVTTDLLYDGVELVAEYDGSGNLIKRHVHGTSIDEPIVSYSSSSTANKSWLYADHLGSIIASSDGVGQAEQLYSYGPYGEPNRNDGARFRYTGQQYLAALGVYHYKARVYSPALGRFLQTDPIGYGDGLNLQAYVLNNPININDPSGEVLNFVFGAAANIVVGGVIRGLSGGDVFDGGAILADAAIGAATSGLGIYSQIRHTRRVVEAARSENRVVGNAQNTHTFLHAAASEQQAARLLNQGANQVYFDRALSTVTGIKRTFKPNTRADVTGVFDDGSLQLVEVASKSQTVAQMAQKNAVAVSQLPQKNYTATSNVLRSFLNWSIAV